VLTLLPGEQLRFYSTSLETSGRVEALWDILNSQTSVKGVFCWFDSQVAQCTAANLITMTSHFVASTCRLDGDAFVSHLNWSKVDSIAAMAVSTVDQNDRETHQILFVNNAGRYMHCTPRHANRLPLAVWIC
jgi:hypothetical protein